jgi:CRP-like cAMP-binding protein
MQVTFVPDAAIERIVLALADPPKDQLRAFIAEGRRLELDKGASLTAIGDASHRFAFVHEGILRYHVITPQGLDVTKDFALAGTFTGSFGSALRNVPAEVAVTAVEPSVLTVWPFARSRELFSRNIEWERLGRRLAEMLYLRKERRELDFLLLDATGRFEAARRELGDAFARIPRHLLASYLGIAPESLSRLRAQKLKKRRA